MTSNEPKELVSTAQNFIDKLEETIDLLAQIPSEDEVHVTFTINQIRERLWEIKDALAEGELIWVAGASSSDRLTTKNEQALLPGKDWELVKAPKREKRTDGNESPNVD